MRLPSAGRVWPPYFFESRLQSDVLHFAAVLKKLGALGLLLGLCVPALHAQPAPWKQQAKALAPLPTIVSNQVQVLEATDESVWIGPLLTVYDEADERLRIADEPALTEGDNVVFSIAARDGAGGGPVWAGLAFDTGGQVAGAGGFLVSRDGGASFTERPSQLDTPDDTSVSYGGSTLPAVPVTQQANSAPQALALGPAADTAWVAGSRSGVRWSADGGRSWTRAVLPPDTLRAVAPSTDADFLVGPPQDDGRGWLNHLGFSVLVDEGGTVWAGTAAGLNRSQPGTVTATGRRGWRRFTAADSARRLPGDFVVALAEQPRPGDRNPVWAATWAGQQQEAQRLQRFGVTVTPDGGDTFRPALIGERIFDLAARPTRVYAAGETGLFVSADQGRTWRSIETFPLRNEDQALPPTVSPQAVAVTDAALWVGTPEGLLRLERRRESDLLEGRPAWRLFRAETPVNPENPSEQVPDVATYAYPNPFSPARDQVVRIAYELPAPGSVEVTIYDFGMNRVHTITDAKSTAGQHETVWDGTDDRGLRVPTGTYFYRVDLGDEVVEGKILMTN